MVAGSPEQSGRTQRALAGCDYSDDSGSSDNDTRKLCAQKRPRVSSGSSSSGGGCENGCEVSDGSGVEDEDQDRGGASSGGNMQTPVLHTASHEYVQRQQDGTYMVQFSAER